MYKKKAHLTLSAPYISESCIKIKTNLNFYFTLLCGPSKGFMKALKAFIKSFEAPQRSVKIKIKLVFFSSSGIGAQRVKLMAMNKKMYTFMLLLLPHFIPLAYFFTPWKQKKTRSFLMFPEDAKIDQLHEIG